MRLIRYFVVGLLLLTSPATASDAYDGELFGYKLGDKYPVTDATQGRFRRIFQNVEIITEHPEKLDEMKEVWIIASVKTFTIGNIFSITEFDTKKEAEAFIKKYKDLLDTRYSKGKKVRTIYDFERLNIELSDKYYLRIMFYDPDKRQPKYKVHIGLEDCCAKEKEIDALMYREFDQLVKEGKAQRLKSARKRGLLKGLE